MNSKIKIIELKCPECGSLEIGKLGFQLLRTGRKQKYQCKKCARHFMLSTMQKKQQKEKMLKQFPKEMNDSTESDERGR